MGEIQNGELKGQRKAIFHTISFLIGFSVIYLVLGFGTAEGATKLEAWYFQYGDLVRQIGIINGCFWPYNSRIITTKIYDEGTQNTYSK